MVTPLKSCRLMKSKGWAPWKPLGWCRFQKMPNLCSSNDKKPGTLFLLYTLSTQKGVPIPRDNFSGSGGISSYYHKLSYENKGGWKFKSDFIMTLTPLCNTGRSVHLVITKAICISNELLSIFQQYSDGQVPLAWVGG
jgi:hypothetical protein